MTYYVYTWSTPEGVPFYVGLGRAERLKHSARNPFTNAVRAKIEGGGDVIKINITEHETRAEAGQEERRLIQLYGRRDNGTGILTNLTDGGEGSLNMADAVKEKIGRAHRGKVVSPETRAKLKEANLKRAPYQRTPEGHARMVEAARRPRSEETKAKMREAWKTREPVSAEVRAKQAATLTGRKLSEETRAKMSASHQKRLKDKAK